MRKLIFLIFIIFLGINAKAQHPEILGSHISYRAIDTLTYEVKLTVIRECSGDLSALNDTLILKADSIEIKQKPTFVSKKDITPIGENCNLKSICDSGTFPYGFEERIYMDTFSLININTCDIYFIWTGNKRSSRLNIATPSENHYNFAYLNYCATKFNSSYTYTSTPKIIAYEGQDYIYGIRSVDTLEINDSVKHFFESPKHSLNTNSNFSKYSWQNFILYLGSFRLPSLAYFPAGIHLDSLLSNLYVRPMKAGEQSIYCVESSEYRTINGKAVKIGITRWDMAIIIIKNTNKVTQNNSLIKYIPPDNFLCANALNEFSFKSTDPDTSDSARFRIDFSGYKNITFSDSFFSKDQTINIKWQPTSKDIRTIKFPYIINLTTYDNNCDVDGVNSLNIPFYLDDRNVLKFDLKDSLYCKGTDAVLRLNNFDTSKIKSIVWDKKLDSDSFVISNSELPKTIEIKVTDTNSCVQIINPLIDTFPTLNTKFQLSKNTFCKNEDAQLKVIFQDSKNIKNIIWNDSISSDSFKILSQNIPTKIKIHITDTFDCSFDTSKFIDNFPHQNPSFLIPDSICFNADSIILKANPSGGIWKGNSIMDSIFYPSKNLTGSNKIEYDFINQNQCKDTATHEIFVTFVREPQIYTNPDTGIIPLNLYYNEASFYNFDSYTWEFTNSKYVYKSTSNNEKIWINDTGFFDVKLTATQNGCSNFIILKNKILIHPKNFVSIKNSTKNIEISIYPNPVKSILSIDLKELNNDISYKILDINGKEILAGNLENLQNNIDINLLSSGLYLVEIFQEKLPVLRTKIIKE